MRTANVTVLSGAGGAGTPPFTTITTDRTWTVGRSPDCDIVVDDGRVSRRHLVVENAGPAWVIRDVSANGSWSAGARIAPTGVLIPELGELRLHLGDPVGPELVFVGEAATVAATAPVPPALAQLPPNPVGRAATPVAAAAMSSGPGTPPRPVATTGDRALAGPTPMPAERRGRRRRRWLIALAVLVVVLVVGDRVAASAASTAAVQQVVEQSQGLGSKPSVSFGGIPFLTQVAFGKYSDIGVGIDDITPPGGPRIRHLSAHLKGAHIPLSKAIGNSLKSIPVDHVTATVAIDFADLNGFLKNQPGQLVLAAGKDGAVEISGNVTQDGTPITVAGSAKLQADGGQLTVVPIDLKVTGTGGFDDLISSFGGLSALFPPIPVPLPDLPFNLRITAARSDGKGLVVAAAADHVNLDTGK